MTESNDKNEFAKTPPLSILHLMAWTLGAAFVLYCSNLRFNLFSDSGFETQTTKIADLTFVLQSIVEGAGIAFIGLWLFRLIRNGVSMLTQPGHWLLFTVGVTACLPIIDYAIRHGTAVIYSGRMWRIGLHVVTALAIIILSLFAMRSKQTARYWKAFFAFRLVTAFYPVLALFLVRWLPPSVTPIPSVIVHGVPMILLICAVIDDARRKEQRDWLHWAGLIVVIAANVLDIALGAAIAIPMLWERWFPTI